MDDVDGMNYLFIYQFYTVADANTTFPLLLPLSLPHRSADVFRFCHGMQKNKKINENKRAPHTHTTQVQDVAETRPGKRFRNK